MRIQPITPLFAIIYADADATVFLPAGPPGGQPIALGYEFVVIDNNGKAGSTNIAISGNIGGGTSGTSITTNFANAIFRWGGSTWTQK